MKMARIGCVLSPLCSLAFRPVTYGAPKRLQINLFSTNHLRTAAGDGNSPSLGFRRVVAGDLDRCYEIEEASYPADEAATRENLLFRSTVASEYFWCATIPRKSPCDGRDGSTADDTVVGFICSTRCSEFEEESMSTHDDSGRILCVHSVVVDEKHRRQGIATHMVQNYLKHIALVHSSLNAHTDNSGIDRVQLLAKSHLLGFYVNNGFSVIRPSPIVHGKETWFELEVRQEWLEKLLRFGPSRSIDLKRKLASRPRAFEKSRSTANPDEGASVFAKGYELRRSKLHNELVNVGIDPDELCAEKFGSAAMRTYNSFLLPKSEGAMAMADSPTRAGVVANSMSFLYREFKADKEQWLINVDRSQDVTDKKHSNPITIVLDNVRSAHNVGNILRLAEAARVESVQLCGMTPRPPHPKVLKTAMGAAEFVEQNNYSCTTIETVRGLRSKGCRVYALETTEKSQSLFEAPFFVEDDTSPVAFVLGNELIGVDITVMRECDGIIKLPTFGFKNSLNVATCAGIAVWDALRRLEKAREDQ
mmetsp:Transcript_15363/g.33728  ORF Transcript_15363/g.33728 Transcript_15363/m.33728 type:complete len:534 (-) Transcript_15363:1217-2818(-)